MLSSILIMTSCKKDDDVTSPKRYYFPVEGVVYDYGDGVHSPSSINPKNVKVILDKDTASVNPDGSFIFQNVIDGEHTVSTYSTIYEPYSKIIQVPFNATLRIELSGKKGDYFPMPLKSLIKFKYDDYAYSGAGNWYNKGEAIWEVKSTRVEGDKRIYSIEETLTYISSSTSAGDVPATHTLITNLDIIESNSQTIQIKAINPLYYTTASYMIDGAQFNRYYDLRLGDIFSLSYRDAAIYLKKNSGLYKIEVYRSRGHTIYELTE